MNRAKGPMSRRGRRGRADAGLLRQIPVFSDLADDELQRLVAVAGWRAYEAGETIVQPGGETRHVIILARGGARVFGQLSSGIDLDVFFLSAGEAADFIDLPAGLADVACCQATEDETIAVRLPRCDLDSVAFPNPAGAELHRQACQRLVELAVQFWGFRFHDALGHLGLVLVELATREPESAVWATHAEIARRMGMHREDVTKLLRTLKERGLIDYQPHRPPIRLLDIARLAGGQ